MSLSTLYTRATVGIEAPLVTVEAHLANGLPGLSIVGLPEMAVRESKDRVRAAIQNSHYDYPSKRITINLAPADLPKQGGCFDLPIALGILIASGQLPREGMDEYEFMGELALSGHVRPVKGILPAAVACHQAKRKLVIPLDNLSEAGFIEGLPCIGLHHILDLSTAINAPSLESGATEPSANISQYPDLNDVKGQPLAKRALEIAAAGGHNLLFSGPPGTGKSMLASRLPGILPPMTQQEALESATVYSVSRLGFDPSQFLHRKFRSPHHTSSGVALVGGGSNPMPGEISLAHNGILFLDELPEFDRKVLEVLREPMENGYINISRAAAQATFPANFQLIAAMNPCPCGYLGDINKQCASCTSERVQRYRNKISGPILDRIDMHVEVNRLSPDKLLSNNEQNTEGSDQIRQRVIQTRNIAINRQKKANANLNVPETETFCGSDTQGKMLLKNAIEKLDLSTRSYHRILRVARTIADMEANDNIQANHIAEAISYRQLDRPLI